MLKVKFLYDINNKSWLEFETLNSNWGAKSLAIQLFSSVKPCPLQEKSCLSLKLQKRKVFLTFWPCTLKEGTLAMPSISGHPCKTAIESNPRGKTFWSEPRPIHFNKHHCQLLQRLYSWLKLTGSLKKRTPIYCLMISELCQLLTKRQVLSFEGELWLLICRNSSK